MHVEGFSVKRHHGCIAIIAHTRSGEQVELEFYGYNVPDLIGLLTVAEDELMLEENAAEAEWESRLETESELRRDQMVETRNELAFDKLGYDYDPPDDGCLHPSPPSTGDNLDLENF